LKTGLEFPDYEQDILRRINYDLKIYNPFFPVLSLLEKLKDDDKMKWELETFNKIYNQCIRVVRHCFYDYVIFEVPHGIISIATFLYVLKKHNIEWTNNSQLADLNKLPDDMKEKIDKVAQVVEHYESTSISKEEAMRALKKFKAYSIPVKPRDDFVKPPEKHIHSSNEQINLGDKA
jgi:hypothetical protein